MDLKSGSNVTGRFIYKVSGDRIVRGGCTNDTTLSECTTKKWARACDVQRLETYS